MIHNIFKTLFVFAILLGFVPTAHALTLEEYWNKSKLWNIWSTNTLANIDCTTSNNKCCSFIPNLTDNDLKKLMVTAHYETGTPEESAIDNSASPIKCSYTPNECFACEFTINKDTSTITPTCFYALNHYNNENITCPTPNDTDVYAQCEYDYGDYTVEETEGLTLETYPYSYCEDSCPNFMTYNADNNTCQCPNNADCSDTDDIKCLAGYYDSTPIGDTVTCTRCPAGSYCPGDIGPESKIQCPAGSYCPADSSTPTKCPEPWSLSAAGSDDINDCYVTLESSVSSDGREGTLQYIDNNNKIKTINVTDAIPNTTEAKALRGYKYPGGPTYHPNTGKEKCQYDAENADTAQNIKIWLKEDACPLATQTNSVTDIQNDPSYRIGTICHAEVTITTACGKIRKEAVPLDDSTKKYLTYKDGAEVNGHFYLTLEKGLFAQDLLSDNYCTSGTDTDKKQFYRTAILCPGGKYCDGFPNGAPNCPDDGTNPTEFPPTGDVTAGYYSSGGAYSATPTGPGAGCLAGNSCGQCPAGSQSAAGAASCSTCSDGTYSDASGATTCKDCEAGYYCTDGNRYKCPAGSTSDAGQSAITSCHIKGDEGGTNFCVNSNCFNIQPDVKAYYSGNTSQ